MMDTAHESQGTVTQHHSHAPQGHPESWQPSQGGSSGKLNDSPVPVPIPDPIASPPMPNPTPVPAPRAGNPFTDEARSIRIQENLEPSSKIVYSLRSPSKSGLGTVKSDFSKTDISKVDFAKVDVKPVPKHLLRGRTPEKAFDSQGIDRQMHTIQSEVIPAASISPPTSNKIQFAR
jgi:hypothetical protein